MKSDKIFIKSIEENINNISSFIKNIDHKAFLNDKKTQFAIHKALENIGEAVKNLSRQFRDANKDVPWKEIAGLRDKLIHGYFDIESKIVWETLKKDIPELKKYLANLKDL